MILVTHQAILTGGALRMAGLAKTFFDVTELLREFPGAALLVALQIGAVLSEDMAGQATAIIHGAQMRLMDEIGETSSLAGQ